MLPLCHFISPGIGGDIWTVDLGFLSREFHDASISAVVKLSTHNPKVKGSNITTDAWWDEMAKW